MLKNQKKIDSSIFLKNVRDRKTNTIESKYIDGLFSRSRDSLHQREIQIIDEMLINKIIEVENYYLCDSEQLPTQTWLRLNLDGASSLRQEKPNSSPVTVSITELYIMMFTKGESLSQAYLIA